MVDENPGLVEEGPVGGEFVLEDESVSVFVGTDLGVGRGVPPAGLCLHQESLDVVQGGAGGLAAGLG